MMMYIELLREPKIAKLRYDEDTILCVVKKSWTMANAS